MSDQEIASGGGQDHLIPNESCYYICFPHNTEFKNTGPRSLVKSQCKLLVVKYAVTG
jgi:hypothetical protein